MKKEHFLLRQVLWIIIFDVFTTISSLFLPIPFYIITAIGIALLFSEIVTKFKIQKAGLNHPSMYGSKKEVLKWSGIYFAVSIGLSFLLPPYLYIPMFWLVLILLRNYLIKRQLKRMVKQA